ncbi:MAG: Ig-like domain-containing protein [Nitriliruptoraceae bacterium]
MSRGRRRLRPRRSLTPEPQPDGLPKAGLFAEPLRVTMLEALEPELVEDGQRRVTFRVEVKDAEGKRCSDLAIDARVTGPERSATVQVVTDLFGRARVRMTGPPGSYELELLEVAAKALRWDAAAGPRRARLDVR